MRRLVAVTAAAGVIGGLSLVAGPPAASAATDPPPTYGASTVLAGGGQGWNGPASSAALPGDIRTDATSGGSLLVGSPEQREVLRIDPATDRMVVVPGTGAGTAPLDVRDVAAAGTGVVVAARQGLVRLGADGTRTTLSTLPGLQLVDVGSDGVVWAATPTQVVRVLTDGTVTAATPATAFTSIRDLVVTPDGSRAYVIDTGTDRFGVYAVTADGVGARVVGNGQNAGGAIDTSLPATSVSTAAVHTLATDGSTLWLASRDQGPVVAASLTTGVLRIAASGAAWTIDRLGSGFALGAAPPGGRGRSPGTAPTGRAWGGWRASTRTVRGRPTAHRRSARCSGTCAAAPGCPAASSSSRPRPDRSGRCGPTARCAPARTSARSQVAPRSR
ncbi:SMP-30/gluconolactonase/LRE family protein [Phycicoccus sp. HDW14]|uniref:SMP-30/gluconolactonase/LRE family protein n=1 Tax=Phycicoccus sp. HDW14 TaxID=2714941 RepID=UPI00140B968C|nr:SMP-30/gluconolactonase/LRE family protein [Phycicoccus sp. HDW14]QIM21761.1 SMP-30/gluconolactonase/LRE family protein [Phycicoccus sp. HDW14]